MDPIVRSLIAFAPGNVFQTPKIEPNLQTPGLDLSKEFSRSKTFSGANAPPRFLRS